MTGELFGRPRTQLAPGAVLIPDWLDAAEQRELVTACRRWARPPAGLRTVRLPGGAQMSVRQLCLGWHWGVVSRCPTCGAARKAAADCPQHWFPYAYTRRVHDGDGAPVKPFPALLDTLARRAVAEAYGDAGTCRDAEAYGEEGVAGAGSAVAGVVGYAPDVALVNHYAAGARMGLHQDREERIDAPVVSLSLGDSCVFRFGNCRTRNGPWTDIELRSGDLLVFGGPARYAYHGVLRTLPGTADPELRLGEPGPALSGRLNITVRQSGLSGAPETPRKPASA
ncbi:alpha-ketoglutarate-dependent dioxygenase AlkB family protein [Kitasatospora kifunensis]|uniref:Alkylated DNA repair protein (DNA oxidative demethylase) n=1 Tax=Kitasatospora kifunensis TaxID=58351 RepID=A0A7W7R647_KITKI|nr:alpha-ketoglutarate-dependent dioxygenase AlkB [Kitasatospora kifunensis]MBB4926107.1 alkylated DNA repair protein (DNA oxidative demethylase) [Kitasatospora kifunensis]